MQSAADIMLGVRVWEPNDASSSVSCEASSLVALGFVSSPLTSGDAMPVGEVGVDWVIKGVGSVVVDCCTLWGVPVVVADPFSALEALVVVDACPEVVDT